jgi:small subunit ribosomal protein S19|uniref:Small ribosomal subunit protein uS19c n=1 Tax=Diphylleia rotans TaxID=190327 RepID=A0A146I7X8_9EUKA|nr:ribosomal protein S19 [Diphylleia rotans]BAU71477.1 ribosomal protein S19 [Diphylleia rotans]
MSRSIWKGPFVDPALISGESSAHQIGTRTQLIQRTTNRNSVILPSHIGKVFEVHNGKSFIKVKVSEEMVGHKLGEFAPTRKRAI